MREVKNVLTTGEVAKICNVAPRTVSKWFDNGHLRGYRIPGSKDRRIPLDHLVHFMRSHNIPLNGIESGHTRVLVLDSETGIGEAIRSTLAEKDGYEVLAATSAIEAGAIVEQHRPHVFLVDVTLPDVSPKVIVRFLRSLSDHTPVKPACRTICLIGMATGLSDSQGQALLQEGFQGYLSKPFETSALVQLIEAEVAATVGA